MSSISMARIIGASLIACFVTSAAAKEIPLVFDGDSRFVDLTCASPREYQQRNGEVCASVTSACPYRISAAFRQIGGKGDGQILSDQLDNGKKAEFCQFEPGKPPTYTYIGSCRLNDAKCEQRRRAR